MCDNQRFYVGTYTESILFGTGEVLPGKGEGIYILELDRKQRHLSVTGIVKDVKNPSFLAVSPSGEYVYAVNELKSYEGEACGSISSFCITGQQGELEFCDRKPTHGQDPCHVAVTGDGEHVIVSNFMTGSVCAYKICQAGGLAETDFVQHHGAGAHPVRQLGPHAHSCVNIRGTDKILIPDLGIDRLMVYSLNEEGGLKLCPEEVVTCQPGDGPRFGEFHPHLDVLYMINELASSITVLRYIREKGQFQCLQNISTLPEVLVGESPPLCSGENWCADLHVTRDGKFLYASNRGHDSIAAFAVDGEDGRLRPLFHTPCGGRTPRNFSIEPEGQFLLVGNQDSDEIVMFEIDRQTGALEKVDQIVVPTPVCICPVSGVCG